MSEEKYYQLGTYTFEQFNQIHDLLCSESSEENIPDRICLCNDDKHHSPTRGSFLLTEEEAELLKNDNRIKFINIDYSMYDEFKPPQEELQSVRPTLFNRYTSSVKNYREFEVSNTLATTPDATDANRTGYQLHRHTQFLDPWVDGALADNAVVNTNISAYGSGKHIDVIVADEGCWIGHPEFQNNTEVTADGSPVEKPTDYEGGNVLPGGGTCDVLDIALDSPYYIDPDWFNEDPGLRLTTRWDGTVVPTEDEARQWWSNPLNRSPQFAAFGSITLSSLYTRADTQGSNTAQPAPFFEGRHGTCCCALTFGRTQGWAYNANKWMLDLYGSNGAGIEIGFDMQKIFHQYKPVNPEFGTKNPTISSNSWGYRASDKGAVDDWYHFRTDAPVQYGGFNAEPTFISHMGLTGDTGRWKSEMKTNSLTTAQDELIDAGVIFVVAAGNSNQKQVNWGHPDFDNYISANSVDALKESNYSEFGVAVTGTTNRRGFPQQGGKNELSDGLGSDFFKRELTVNGVRIVGAGSVGGQVAVPDAWLEKVGRMFELFLDPNGAGINETAQRTVIKTLSGDAGTYHAAQGPTLQRVARGAGSDYSTNFLDDAGIAFWNLSPLFDSHVANDMVWYLNSTGDGYGVGDTDAQEVIEHVFHTLHMHGLDAVSLKMYSFISADWASGPLYAAMEEAYDAGMWDPSGYQPPGSPDEWKTDGDAFEVAAKEYLFLLNFAMFEYTELWDGGSLAPEWSDLMRTQAGILANNPLGYALHNTYIAPVISKPSLATIRSIFQDGNTPAQDDPRLAGASGYVVSNGSTQDPEYNNGPLINNGEVTYKTINVGALDDDYAAGNLERKVNYSDRGNGIEVYAAADGTLAANKNYVNEGVRPDTYTGLSVVAYDAAFSGTSAACPVVAGFLATILEHNRDWTYAEIKDWLSKLDAQDPANFYYGVESTTATSANWTDYNSLEGGDARVLYPGPFDARFVAGPRKVVDTGLNLRNGLTLRFNK